MKLETEPALLTPLTLKKAKKPNVSERLAFLSNRLKQ